MIQSGPSRKVPSLLELVLPGFAADGAYRPTVAYVVVPLLAALLRSPSLREVASRSEADEHTHRSLPPQMPRTAAPRGRAMLSGDAI